MWCYGPIAVFARVAREDHAGQNRVRWKKAESRIDGDSDALLAQEFV